MSVSSVPTAPPALPHFSTETAQYCAPRAAGPVLVLANRRAFRNPKLYLERTESPEVLRCEGVPEEVPAGVQAVGRLPGMQSVRAVEWSWKGPVNGDEHLLINFLDSPAFADLDTLWLDAATTSAGTVKARSGRFLAQLAQADRLPGQHFHVAGLQIDIHTIRTVRDWEGRGRLLSLRLVDARGGRRWSRLMSTLPADNQLRFIDFGGSDLGDAGVDALLARPLPHLERLVLRAIGLTDAGAATLLAWSGLARLSVLDLRGNDLSDATCQQLRDRLGDVVRLD